jgi:positive regulator of sigma E activity
MGPILLEKLGRRTLIIAASFVYIFLPLVAFVAQILSEAYGPNQLTVIMGIVIVFIRLLIS